MGGIVATNAGGQYYYRYQSLLANIIGLQCVTGTGTILNWKYNTVDRSSTTSNTSTNTTTAVNFKDKLYPLLIGSEGNLGIITGITLKCTPYLPNRQTMMVTISSSLPSAASSSSNPNGTWSCTNPNWKDDDNSNIVNYILQIVQVAHRCFGETLAAVEWMDPNIVNVIEKSFDHDATRRTKLHHLLLSSSTTAPSTKVSVEHQATKPTLLYPHCILIETHGTNQQHDEEKCYDLGIVPIIRKITHDSSRRSMTLMDDNQNGRKDTTTTAASAATEVFLHSASDDERTALLPANGRNGGLNALMKVLREYCDVTGRRITIEWALIAGQNDNIQTAQQLGRLLVRHPQYPLRPDLVHVNVIPLNPTAMFQGQF